MKSKQFAHFMKLWSITASRRDAFARKTADARVLAAKRTLRNILPAAASLR